MKIVFLSYAKNLAIARFFVFT